MAFRSKSKASVMTYGDHEVIMPDETLRAAVLKARRGPAKRIR